MILPDRMCMNNLCMEYGPKGMILETGDCGVSARIYRCPVCGHDERIDYPTNERGQPLWFSKDVI